MRTLILQPQYFIFFFCILLNCIGLNVLRAGEPIPDTIKNREELFTYYIQQGEILWKTDKWKADSLARIALELSRDTVINDSLLAEGYHLMGKILVDLGDYQAGIDTLQKCIFLKDHAYGKNNIRTSRTYNYIGLGYYYSMNFESAQIYYQKAIEVASTSPVLIPELFDSYTNLGILNNTRGKLRKSYEYFGKARIVLDSMGKEADSILIAKFHLIYGRLAITTGKLREASEYFSLSENIFLNKYGKNYYWLAILYTSMGEIEKINENYQQAYLLYQKALDIFLKNNLKKTGIPQTYYHLAELAVKMKDYRKAIFFCKKGLEYQPVPNIRLSIIQFLASSYGKIGDQDNAEKYFKLCLDLIKSNNVHLLKKAFVHSDYADFLFDINQYEKSKLHYYLALEMTNTAVGSINDISSVIYSKLGICYLHAGDIEQAQQQFDTAIYFWNTYFNLDEDKLSSFIPNETDFVDAYRGKAKTLFFQYKNTGNTKYLKKSLEYYRILLRRVELIIKNLDKENNYLLVEKIKPTYIEAIQVAYSNYVLCPTAENFKVLFELSEMSKSTVLLNQIQNSYALSSADIPEEIVEFEMQLKNQINLFKKLMVENLSEERNSESSLSKNSFYNSRILSLMLQHDSLKRELEKNYPKYYKLKFQRNVVTMENLQSQLSKNQILLEYVLADTVLYLITIQKDTFQIISKPLDDSFHLSLLDIISIRNTKINKLGKDDITKFIKNSGNLWRHLIAPLKMDISGKHLIIVPDDLLGYLPFEILVRSDSLFDTSSFRQIPYLFRNNPISYTYSATLKYTPLRKEKHSASKGLVSFSPSYNYSFRVDSCGMVKLSDLPYADAEAAAVKSIIGGKTYRNKEATKSRFLRVSKDHQLIHLAMHANLNDSIPLYSELIFASEPNHSKSNVLYTYEVFGLDLNADLITLSACNTGTGKLQSGEGIRSLARAFFSAGVPAVLMTLWEIEDKSGYEIMKAFYKYLKAGEPKDIALQKAKIDFINQATLLKSHPYFWASYIVSGDSSSIALKNQHNVTWIQILGIVFAATLLLYILYKSKGRTEPFANYRKRKNS